MLTSIRGLFAATLLAGTALAATPAFADEADAPSEFTITGSATIASQYRFRGLSQSDQKPVVQASLTIAHDSGFYVSTWASSASANLAQSPIDIGGTEIDIYGGWTKDLGGVTVDVGGYGYLYPGAPNSNYFELYGSVAKTFGPVGAKVGIYYAPSQRVFNFNFTSPDRHNVYVYGDLSYGIPGTPITLNGHLGYTDGGFEWGKAYLDYKFGAAVKWKMLTLDASVVGTNVSRNDVNNGFGCGAVAACITYFKSPAKTVGVVSLTASF